MVFLNSNSHFRLVDQDSPLRRPAALSGISRSTVVSRPEATPGLTAFNISLKERGDLLALGGFGLGLHFICFSLLTRPPSVRIRPVLLSPSVPPTRPHRVSRPCLEQAKCRQTESEITVTIRTTTADVATKASLFRRTSF